MLVEKAEKVLAAAKQLAPVADGTHSYHDGLYQNSGGGRFRDNLKYGFTTQRGKKVIRIFSDARNSRGQQYGLFIVRGTKPHVIRARNQPNLQFQWIKRNVFVIAKQVEHPGTRKNDFLKLALQRSFN